MNGFSSLFNNTRFMRRLEIAMQYINKKSIILSLCLTVFAIAAICIRVDSQSGIGNSRLIGGTLIKASAIEDITSEDTSLSRQAISILSEKQASLNETYFRPSKLKALNNAFADYEKFTETFKDEKIPATLLDSPVNAILNYFSILQQASNLTPEKSGGCGTVGYAAAPYPIAYRFLSDRYRKEMSYEEYLTSFQGTGHINLIKTIPMMTVDADKYKYFIELEILEGTNVGATTFVYYTGEITLVNRNNLFYIDSLLLVPEDFFCAAYHGWYHDAEAFVEIVYGNWCGLILKQYVPQQDEFTKEIMIDGVDNKKYLFRFATLTNGTDLLINTLVRNGKQWVPVEIDVKKCLEKNKGRPY